MRTSLINFTFSHDQLSDFSFFLIAHYILVENLRFFNGCALQCSLLALSFCFPTFVYGSTSYAISFCFTCCLSVLDDVRLSQCLSKASRNLSIDMIFISIHFCSFSSVRKFKCNPAHKREVMPSLVVRSVLYPVVGSTL